jgi:citrate lyase beta subunit
MNYLQLGATLYMPSLRMDMAEVGNGSKIENLRTVVFCAEDSIRDCDLPQALENLKNLLPRLEPGGISKFIRPRNPEVLKSLLRMPFIEKITGFVLPKADGSSLPEYFKILRHYDNFKIMPTLETTVAFNLFDLYKLRDYISESPLSSRIIALRIGSLDLLNILNLRRDLKKTIYESPLGHTVDQLINVFKPAHIELAAPGFEGLDYNEVLDQELHLDMGRGLFAKTAIHPSQVDIINSAYKVRPDELEMAKAIVDPQNPAVFRLGDRMCEKAVHINWALRVLERARLFGSYQFNSDPYRLKSIEPSVLD